MKTYYNIYEKATGKTVASYDIWEYDAIVQAWGDKLHAKTHNFFVSESQTEDFPDTLTFEV